MTPLLSLEDIHKRFPGVYALKGVNFAVQPGEVHALVGENGAGKSTLIKIAAGVYLRDQGRYQVAGHPVDIRHPRQALDHGLAVVYQELELVPSLSVAENLFFGRLPHGRGGRVQWNALYDASAKLLEEVGLTVNPQTKVGHLGVAAQQLVEIARALACDAQVIIMDEPTSALSTREIDKLFALIARLKARGVGVVYVSHKLAEVMALADRVTVLRDGERVACEQAADLDEEQLIALMVGRELGQGFPAADRTPGPCALEVEGLTTDRVQDISFRVCAGEIVGFSGLMGAGRTELARAVMGADRRRAGTITIDGVTVPANAPPQARTLGLGLVPEDRRADGLFAQQSVRANASVAALEQFCRAGHVQVGMERQQVGALVARLRLRPPDQEQTIARLSGGNQQKALLARWLLKENLRVLLVDEPTRGIDVGAKAEIYQLLDGLARQGLAIVVLSSEMPEILGLCDRVYVMREGRIAAEYARAEATPEKLLASALPSAS